MLLDLREKRKQVNSAMRQAEDIAIRLGERRHFDVSFAFRKELTGRKENLRQSFDNGPYRLYTHCRLRHKLIR